MIGFLDPRFNVIVLPTVTFIVLVMIRFRMFNSRRYRLELLLAEIFIVLSQQISLSLNRIGIIIVCNNLVL